MLLNETHQRRLLSHSEHVQSNCDKRISESSERNKLLELSLAQVSQSYQQALELFWASRIELENERLERYQNQALYQETLNQQREWADSHKKGQLVLSDKVAQLSGKPGDHWPIIAKEISVIVSELIPTISTSDNDSLLESTIKKWELERATSNNQYLDFEKVTELLEQSYVIQNLLEPLKLEVQTLDAPVQQSDSPLRQNSDHGTFNNTVSIQR